MNQLQRLYIAYFEPNIFCNQETIFQIRIQKNAPKLSVKGNIIRRCAVTKCVAIRFNESCVFIA